MILGPRAIASPSLDSTEANLFNSSRKHSGGISLPSLSSQSCRWICVIPIFQVIFFCLQGREGDGEQGMNGTFENFSGPLSSAPNYDLRVEIGE